MIFTTKNNQQVHLGRLSTNHHNQLFHYLQQLSTETKKRFGPHSFDRQAIADFYSNKSENIGYIATDETSGETVAYSIIRKGFLYEDGKRLQSYGMEPNSESDCTFAPSVADAWQGLGVGNSLFQFILAQLKEHGYKRIILWGGVQTDNEKAVKYYQKNGFRKIGQFEFNGLNDDMISDID
jgi:ribosomal protein S18 acetylase RimI-like enzyme